MANNQTQNDTIRRIIKALEQTISEGDKPHLPSPDKPLYEHTYEALRQAGRPITTKELLRRVRRLSGRQNLTAMLVYQSAEYNRRHKKTVDRQPGGVWAAKKSNAGH